MKKSKVPLTFRLPALLLSLALSIACFQGRAWALNADGSTAAGNSGQDSAAEESAAPSEESVAESQPDTSTEISAELASGETSPMEREVSEEEIEAFYQNTVFIGDSIMLGFRNYAAKSSDPLLTELNFLSAGSYGVNHALEPVSANSLHPVYMGQQRLLWESVQLMEAKRLFICFGMNDLNISKDNTVNLYQQLLQNIADFSPGIEINIISMTPVLKGSEKGRLNNNYIRSYNMLLQEMAAANGWLYVDFATALCNANGDLAMENCSDNYVHLTSNAYAIWTNLLRSYAVVRLKYT